MVEVDEWCVVAVVDVCWKLFNVFEVEVLLYVKKFEVFSWRFSKKFFKNFQSSEEMLSLRGVVNDLRAYSNLVCVVSAFLALFLAQVFPCLILIRIWPQFLCHPFLFPAWELFHVVNLALSGCYLLWVLLSMSEPMVCTVKNWIFELFWFFMSCPVRIATWILFHRLVEVVVWG